MKESNWVYFTFISKEINVIMQVNIFGWTHTDFEFFCDKDSFL